MSKTLFSVWLVGQAHGTPPSTSHLTRVRRKPARPRRTARAKSALAPQDHPSVPQVVPREITREVDCPKCAGAGLTPPTVDMLRVQGATITVPVLSPTAEDLMHIAYEQAKVGTLFMDKDEVTVGEYRACVISGRCSPFGGGTQCDRVMKRLGKTRPAQCVNQDQAEAYCRWTGQRLPTNAEWELAWRGSNGRKYPWGDEPLTPARAAFCYSSSFACFSRVSGPVGKHPKGCTPEGICDLAGNVAELVTNGSRDPNSQVFRGGSCGVTPEDVKPAWMDSGAMGGAGVAVGFRCAQDVPSQH